MFNKLFGNKESQIILDVSAITLPILFHKEANGHVQHGTLVAEHHTLRVGKNDGVRFCFPDVEAPKLTPALMAYIFDQAERKGYIVHSLHSYVNVAQVMQPPKLDYVTDDKSGGGGRGIARTARRPSGARAAEPAHAG